MTPRIIIPCSDVVYRRHRWHWRKVYGAPVVVFDRWCGRCGQWYNDVIEHKEVNP